ncbi:endolytic transglycosylase MltG [Blastomonas marina]|uniref:endolytic transglycosylase MltG n=1 Tax=Blastomonas marina TaxID=1867408 RepID=UPI002AC89F4F|nr:endolytic transglycosylase MltG [Blastomonas marina]WPZ05014.1 endolytic transglycosylase MltG [Blastomonas marina]
MKRRGVLFGFALLAAGLALLGFLLLPWYADGPLDEDRNFVVPQGSSLASVAQKMEEEGLLSSADGFLLRAKFLGGNAPIKAGEFSFPAGASPARLLQLMQDGDVINRMITIPEGLPSILVYERLMANPLLVGEIDVPEDGTILPQTYSFERGEPRADVVRRMQAAMRRVLAEEWEKRGTDLAVATPEEALVLASIVEKETGVPSERRMVAGLYSNRLKQGIRLQADPTIIYPITRGKPLGRRILQSEIDAVNDYNTYSMVGLPKGPITNPGRESIAAVLNPAQTDAVYMVADGTGGHVFASTYEEHRANVEKWFAIRRARGEL